MKIPDPSTVDVAELAKSLMAAADAILLVDGDRDHMNQSRLTCELTQAIATLLVVASAKLVETADEIGHMNRLLSGVESMRDLERRGLNRGPPAKGFDLEPDPFDPSTRCRG